MLCPPPPAVRSALIAPPTTAPPPELVEVRTEPVDGVETPTQLLRQGRLWLVRSAERRPGAGQAWRVHAGPGPAAAPAVLELQQGANGRWSLTELADAAPAEVAAWA